MVESNTSIDVAVSPAEAAFEGVMRLNRGTVPLVGGRGRVIFLGAAEHLAFGLGLRGEDGIVFSPPGGTTSQGVVSYEGSLSEPGDELLVAGEFSFHCQDYLATPFLAVSGPTIVRVTGDHDYDAFLQDADLAKETGAFVEQLLQPGVLLADQCALGTTHRCAGSGRLRIGESGEIRTAPGGVVIGDVATGVDDLLRAADTPASSGESCLNAVVDPTVLDRMRDRRPWLSRYLRAIDVQRGLRGVGRSGYRVSGFGGRLVTTLPPEAGEHVDAPLLAWNDEEFLLCDPIREQVFELGPDAAKLVELILVAGSAEAAADLAVTHVGLDHATALAAVSAVTTELPDLAPVRSQVRA